MRSSERQFHLVYVAALVLSVSLNIVFMSRDGEKVKSLAIKMTSSFLPPPPKTKEAFAACLLVMDDNHRLTEWLAYHYHVLPMDYLVVGVDPNSKTSPASIFEKWRGYGMTIIEWNNTDIFNGMLWEYDNIIMKRRRMPHDHRQRQNMFLRNCLAHMRDHKRSWVLLTDSDEYLLFNGPSKTIPTRPVYPMIRERATIMSYLQEELKHENSDVAKSPCIAIPRILFGSVKSALEYQNKPVPLGFQADSFDTMRYRKHLKRHKEKHDLRNGWAKALIDVSRLNDSDIPSARDAFRTNPYRLNVHQPLPKVCPEPFIKDFDSVFRINHYVGSWEAFSYRKDARADEGRGIEKWKEKADAADETDDVIRDWLGGFVDEYGSEKAAEMLSQAGVFTQKLS